MSGVLVATDINFWPENRGSRCRIAALLRALVDAQLDVSVFLERTDVSADTAATIERQYGLHSLHTLPFKPKKDGKGLQGWFRRKVQGWRGLGGFFPASERTLDDFRDPSTGLHFKATVERFRPSAVIIEMIRLAWLLDEIPESETLRILDTHDVMWLRYERHREQGVPHWLRITREEESRALSQFDTLLAIQPEEAAEFRKMTAPAVQILTIGHAVPAVKLDRQRKAELRIGFIGGNSEANRAAIQWFFDNVYAQVCHFTTLEVAGPVCSGLRRQIPSEYLIGPVESVRDFYQRIDVLVNPVFMGGGLKIKNVEAMAHGVPVVTSKLGAEGLSDVPYPALVIASTDQEFLTALQRFHADRQLLEHSSSLALDFAARTFSPEAVYDPLIRLLTT